MELHPPANFTKRTSERRTTSYHNMISISRSHTFFIHVLFSIPMSFWIFLFLPVISAVLAADTSRGSEDSNRNGRVNIRRRRLRKGGESAVQWGTTEGSKHITTQNQESASKPLMTKRNGISAAPSLSKFDLIMNLIQSPTLEPSSESPTTYLPSTYLPSTYEPTYLPSTYEPTYEPTTYFPTLSQSAEEAGLTTAEKDIDSLSFNMAVNDGSRSKSPTFSPTTYQPTYATSTYEPSTNEPTYETSTLGPSTTYPTFSPSAIADTNYTANNTDSVTALGDITFRRGDLVVRNRRLGIKVCTGMSVKIIAKANQKIPLLDGNYPNIPFHSMADGAAIFSLDNGYVYVSNSEMKEGKGGVYGLYFDKNGNAVDYQKMLSGTTKNCGGGVTPWNTWISCEEYGKGQCWQVDPKNQITPQITKLGGHGGNYESVAVDNRNAAQPIFFLTEDAEYGALRKYTPPIIYSNETNSTITPNWHTLHSDGGKTEYLMFHHGTNKFKWTTNLRKARQSQAEYFRNVEGINFHNGYLYFVSKKMYRLYVLDLDNGTYTTSSTKWGVMGEGGEFEHSPDQIVRNGGEYLYFTEDGGNSAGVYAIHKQTRSRYAIFEAYANKYKSDETTGLAFSPDGTKMYAAFQDCGCKYSGWDYDCGCLMEFRRKDGRSFDGSTLSLKFHSSKD